MKKIISLLVVFSIILTLFACPFTVEAAATGQQIVSKAMEYIGKVPYVWGGTNIDGANPGADCSGFICRIYEKFGINMWANRTKLRNCGTNLGTNMDVAMLGDIIWYDGHVAIYAGRDSKGNHMVVHETGGNIQNVAYTKHSIVSAELKGIIRIPGVYNDGTTVEIKKASFSTATDTAYTGKAFITETNACVVTQVNKNSGVKVTQMGLYLYDANGTLIKKYTENVSNVGNNTTKYHSWYDINTEVGIKLTPGTTYKYAFFGVFDGQEITGSTYSFKTTGTAPQPQVEKCKVTFYINYDNTQTKVIEVNKGAALGTLPTPIQYSGHTFDGYYTAKTGGTKASEKSIVNGNVTLYPRYIEIDYSEYEKETVENCMVTFIINPDYSKTKTVYVEKGAKVGTLPTPVQYSGYDFDGYYTSSKGGEKITKNTIITGNSTFYPRYVEKDYSEYEQETSNNGKNRIELKIDNPNMYLNGKQKKIDDNGTAPFIHNSRTLLPVRAVIEAMGGTVGWDANSQVITLKKDGKTLFLMIDFENAWDTAGGVFKLDAPPMIKNGRTMLPIRFVVEYFGGTVGWNQADQSVTIDY